MQNGYLELKISWEIFRKSPTGLSGPESARLTEIVARQNQIEQQILASPESAQVMVPESTLATKIEEVCALYQGELAFSEDLKQSIARDLHVEAVLEKIAAQVAPLSSVEAEIYYRLHPEAFTPPESRRLRHILITFNNSKEKAKAIALLESLRSTLGNAEEFAEAALRHSQCPTAMEGGQLGVAKRQQLFPELEDAAFALGENEISGILESPIGLHLMRCDEILPAATLPFSQVEMKIIERLSEKRRAQAQKSWIKALFAKPQSITI